MSTGADRDLEAELSTAEAGRSGFPVDALCTGCHRTHVKRVQPKEIGQHPQIDPTTLEAGDLTSFRHICHRCGSVTWWNPTAVLTGLIELEAGGDDA